MYGWFNVMLLAAEEEAPKATWGIFAEGKVAEFLFLLIFVGFVWFMITRARAGQVIPEIRRIAGLEAVDEAIGRATEMGRPVHITPGLGTVSSGPTIAFYAFLGYVAKTAARYDVRFVNTNRNVYVHAINEEIIRQAYLEAGRPDAYNPDDVRYLSGFQFAYTAGVLGFFQREKPAANLMLGYFYAESMILIETAQWVGAITVGGTTSTAQLPFFVAGADYTLIGEEIYAASAYLSRQPVLRGTVVGQDWGKLLIFALILIGAVLANTASGAADALGSFISDF